jgi:hypothetical protein
MISPRAILEAYTNTLHQQKRIIQTNTYARELELKYHKQNHRRFKRMKLNQNPNTEEFSQWPIESSVFTKVLRSKLHNIPSKSSEKPGYTRSIIKEIKQNFSRRICSQETAFPRLDRSRYWSPPKPISHLTMEMKDEFMNLGPYVQPIKYCTKKRVYSLQKPIKN